jgi:hypothetical protein
MSCVTTGVPCSVAAESQTTMNRTLRFYNTRSRQSSLSENGSGAATDQAPLQSFQRRLFQQNQGVADIIAVGPGIGRENFFDAH